MGASPATSATASTIPRGLGPALAAAAWCGLAEGGRAALSGARPWSPPDLAAAVTTHALLGAFAGLAGAALLRRALARAAAPVPGPTHVVLFVFGSLFLAGRLLPRRNATDSLAINAALAAVAVTLLATLLLLHARRAAGRGQDRSAAGRRTRVVLALVPWAAAAGSLVVPWTPGDLSALPAVVPPAGGARPPNVLVVLVDSLRADRVGACGGARGLTPSLDAFAAEGTAFRQARTSSPWTKPSVASLHTGLRPERHGVTTVDAVLPREAPPLLSFFHRAGYRTAVLTDSHWPVPEFGFDRGVNGLFLGPDAGGIRGTSLWRTVADLRDFAVDAYRVEKPAVLRGAADLSHRLLRWTEGLGDTPWAAYLHWMEPHHPYAPPGGDGPSRRRIPVPVFLGTVPLDSGEPLPPDHLADLVANYDDEVRATDAAFGALVAGLEERGVLENTIVVFLADHGEEFFEHGGWTHGHSLLDEVVRIPLVIRAPGGVGRARVVDDAVRIEDVLPTVLDLAGVGTDVPFDGASLLPLLRGEREEGAGRPAWGYCRRISSPTRLYSALQGPRKLVLAVRDDLRREWVYDLAGDPAEASPLDPGQGTDEAVARLRARIADALGLRPLEGEGATLDPAARQALEALGYLGKPESPR